MLRTHFLILFVREPDAFGSWLAKVYGLGRVEVDASSPVGN